MRTTARNRARRKWIVANLRVFRLTLSGPMTKRRLLSWFVVVALGVLGFFSISACVIFRPDVPGESSPVHFIELISTGVLGLAGALVAYLLVERSAFVRLFVDIKDRTAELVQEVARSVHAHVKSNDQASSSDLGTEVFRGRNLEREMVSSRFPHKVLDSMGAMIEELEVFTYASWDRFPEGHPSDDERSKRALTTAIRLHETWPTEAERLEVVEPNLIFLLNTIASEVPSLDCQ